ncbi:MAG: VOC family protein [Pseudomonadota bacterium]
MTPHGHFHWNELMTRDVAGAKAFYSDALGWTYSEMPDPDTGSTYFIAMDGELPVGGMFDITNIPGMDQVPASWMAYIAVDDIDARVEKAKAGGATIVREPWDVPGVGRIAMVMQPDGAHIGWMTPAAEQG